MATSGEQGSEYILEHNNAEYERLNAQAQIWGPITSHAISRTDLGTGMSALDVGCGTGAAMQLLGQVVGSSGSVTGVDNDDQLGAHTLERLRSLGPDIYRFVAGDFMTLEHFEGIGQFDLVFARLLLIHMPDPLIALSRMWNCVKPGGTILIMDFDMTSQRTFSSFPVVDRAAQLMRDIFVASGKDIEIGSRMPDLFVRAGLGVPDACHVNSMVVPAMGGGGMTRQVLKSLRQAAIKNNVTDGTSLDELDQELSQLPPKGFARWPDLVATHRRKSS